MNKKALVVIILLLIGLALGGYTYFASRIGGVSGLKVVSTPTANIFLNDKLIGKTPYEDKQPAGSYIVKLIPDDSSAQVTSWQDKITLQPQLLTVIQRELGMSELSSSGEILTLEKTSQSSESQVAVLSKPDAASVLFDGQEKGTTPLLIRNTVPGEHDIAIISTGFKSRTVRVQTTLGYKLSVNFQLALVNEESTSSATPSPSVSGEEQNKTFITIKDTPTGFLRVRKEPSTSAEEITQVKPNSKYPMLEERSGWYKISLEDDKEGWVSARYAEKSDQ